MLTRNEPAGHQRQHLREKLRDQRNQEDDKKTTTRSFARSLSVARFCLIAQYQIRIPTFEIEFNWEGICLGIFFGVLFGDIFSPFMLYLPLFSAFGYRLGFFFV